MIVTYLTGDNVLVSVCHVGSGEKPGQSKWQVLVEGMGGMARWGVPDLICSPGWSTERVARHALEWARDLPASEPCPCPDPECPGKEPTTALEVFAPTPPHEVSLHGPYFDKQDAIVAAMVQSGSLDEDDIDSRSPTVEELIAELDGIDPPPEPPDDPPDPYRGSTWRLG
jgi:hypothetical protein